MKISETEIRDKPQSLSDGRKVLNIGSGGDWYGTDRLDFKKSGAVTKVYDFKDKIPYPDNTFDEIRFWRTLEHLENLGFIIDECYRVLKKGGVIDVITDHAGYFIFYFKSEHNSYLNVEPYHKHPDDFHRYLFVPSHLKALFMKFKNIDESYLHRRNKKGLKRLFLNLVPFHMGYEELRLIAYK